MFDKPSMKYENMCKGKFIGRPNRFIAEVEIDGRTVRAHVKNTGRCQELLVPGTEVWLEDFAERMGNRKLRYALIGVQKGDLLVNMDSQAPNKVCEEALISAYREGRETCSGIDTSGGAGISGIRAFCHSDERRVPV